MIRKDTNQYNGDYNTRITKQIINIKLKYKKKKKNRDDEKGNCGR